MQRHSPAIVSVSLGRAHLHDLIRKIEQAAKFGYAGIEIFYEDLSIFAEQLAGKYGDPTTGELIAAARRVRELCESHGLVIISLQPFSFYEGLKDRQQHKRRVEVLQSVWFPLVKELGTDIIQIPANFLPAEQLTSDLDVIVSDLLELADLGLRQDPVVKFVYENLCWSTYIDTWEKAWDVVKLVDRPNFGICLDTFNIAGRIWADPTSPAGKVPDGDEILKSSMTRLVEEIDVRKVFYIQIVDAERMDPPLSKDHPWHVDGQVPRMTWSRNARTFLYEGERGAYLPVESIAATLISSLGYEGFVSMELFSRSLAEVSPNVPQDHARRGMKSWRRLEQRLQLNQQLQAED